MSYRLIIGNKNYSSWSLRAWILMRHFDLPFEEIIIPLDTEEFHRRIGEYSPAGKVPTLLHDGFAIWDSLAIGEFLAERHPDKEMWPSDSQARARARSVSAEMHSGFSNLRNEMPMNCRAENRKINFTHAITADIERVQIIWQKCRESYGERGPWLFGDYSIADAMFAPVVCRFHTYGVKLSDISLSYVEFVLASPSMQEWYQASMAESETIAQEEVGL